MTPVPSRATGEDGRAALGSECKLRLGVCCVFRLFYVAPETTTRFSDRPWGVSKPTRPRDRFYCARGSGNCTAGRGRKLRPRAGGSAQYGAVTSLKRPLAVALIVLALLGSSVVAQGAQPSGSGGGSWPASTAAAQHQRMILLDREASVWSAEAALAGAQILPFARSLPGLRAHIAQLGQEADRLTAVIQRAHRAAVAAAVSEYITSEQAPALLGMGGVTTTQILTGVYQKLVVSQRVAAITAYERVLHHSGQLRDVVKARLEVLASTLPDLYLNASQLTAQARQALAGAERLSHAVRAPVVLHTEQALNILGPSTLTAAEMAGWWASMGYRNNTGVSMLKIAQTYINAGNQAGVAGDVAFAQAVLETGGFAAMSGPNNFAGIGACGSCNGGYGFSSFIDGIRAQVQLLEAYAKKNLSSAQLVGGVAYRGIDTLSVRGCCQTWPTLSSHWSSGVHYGDVVLGIYSKMLAYAVQHING